MFFVELKQNPTCMLFLSITEFLVPSSTCTCFPHPYPGPSRDPAVHRPPSILPPRPLTVTLPCQPSPGLLRCCTWSLVLVPERAAGREPRRNPACPGSAGISCTHARGGGRAAHSHRGRPNEGQRQKQPECQWADPADDREGVYLGGGHDAVEEEWGPPCS